MKSVEQFKRVNREKSNGSTKLDAVAFYKLLMTTSNLHSTIHSFYDLIGENGSAKYHQELSRRFLAEANLLKSLKIDVSVKASSKD